MWANLRIITGKPALSAPCVWLSGPGIAQGHAVEPYKGPAPPAGSGPHRYILRVFRQLSNLTVRPSAWSRRSRCSSSTQGSNLGGLAGHPALLVAFQAEGLLPETVACRVHFRRHAWRKETHFDFLSRFPEMSQRIRPPPQEIHRQNVAQMFYSVCWTCCRIPHVVAEIWLESEWSLEKCWGTLLSCLQACVHCENFAVFHDLPPEKLPKYTTLSQHFVFVPDQNVLLK